MAKCGNGKSGKSKEQIFQTCITKALFTAPVSPYLLSAQEFQEAVNVARQNYVAQLRILKQKKVM